MFELLLLLGGAALVNNFVLVQLLGLCPIMGVSNRWETALPMGLATIFVITLATLGTHLLNRFILVPLEIEYLRIVVYITVIAAAVQATDRYVRFVSTFLHQILGIYLPLIASNCAILAVTLTVADLPVGDALVFGVGAGIGFTIVLVVFAGLRSRIHLDSVPRIFKGAPIAFITAGIMALGFYGFKGLF